MNNPTQLIFPFQVNQRANFKSFFWSPDNINLKNRLDDLVNGDDFSELMIHGKKASGKSFLMQAICNEFSLRKIQFAFIPMKKAINMGPELFQNLSSLDAVCIDDIQLLLSNADWERAMFNLINECQQSSCSLIFTLGDNKPLEESIELPDLVSRIKRMEFMTLKKIEDDLHYEALDFISKQLEINLKKTELEFLLNHQIREFSILVENLVTLDKQAGTLKRKITIPLIKETLSL